jgi:hypothetical protein
MLRPNRILPLLAAGLLVAGGACTDSTGGNDSQVQLALQPQFPASYTPGVFELAVDRVRVLLIRPPAEAVVDTLVLFPADETELNVRIRVPLISKRETLTATLEMSGGTQVLFSGTSAIEVTNSVSLAPTIPLQYVGPGLLMTSLRIEPRDSALRPGQAFTYRIHAFSGLSALEDFYVGWSTDDPDHVRIDANGALVAPDARGSFLLRVVSPTGVKDSTRVWISPPAASMTYIGGNEQTGAVLTKLPGLLIVRLMALDGLGVPGVPVQFTPLSGGTVGAPVILTDAEGYARNTVILGPMAGLQLFEATTAGMPTVTFRATATPGPPFRITALAGGNQQGTVGQVLPDALIARVSDRAGNFTPGVPVTWEVVSGGGVLEQVDAKTNLNGVALGIYRLGTLPSTNSIRVTATGFPASVDFRARALAGPASIIEPISGNGQTGLPGGTLAPFTVLVTDEFRNPLRGVTVRWRVLDGGGELGNETTTTDISGRASVTYQLSNLPGTAHIRAEVVSNGLGTTFTATAAEPPT